MVTFRPVRLPDDRAQLLGLDRSFTTDRIYRVMPTPQAFMIEEVQAHPPVRKVFALTDDDLADGRVWADGIVAEHLDVLVGFAAFTHQHWNRRTEIWHLYVASHLRGQGVGRMLVEAVAAAAGAAGMRCLWLETSTLAYPAIQFYRRLGFELCGLDTSLYDPAGLPPGETALYFARPL